jgi:hypothetical protein
MDANPGNENGPDIYCRLFSRQMIIAWTPAPGTKMPRRYRAEVAGSQQPRKWKQPRAMKPSWLAPVCRVCLAKPETNSCARPTACLGTRLSGQTRPGTFKQRFRHSPKDLAHLLRQRTSSRRGCWFDSPARPHRRRRFSRGKGRIFTIKR